MKKFLLLTAFISLFSLAQAQEFHYGVFLGANLNTMKIDNNLLIGSNPDFCKKQMTTGFNGSAFAEYVFGEHIGVQAELGFAQYGYSLKLDNEASFPMEDVGTVTTKEFGEEKTTLNSINLALMFKCYFFDQHLAIDLGVQPNWACSVSRHDEIYTSVALDGQILDETSIDTTMKLDRSTSFHPFNFSAIAGATYNINKNFFVSARYIHGFMNTFFKDEEAGYFENGEYVIKTVRTEYLSKRRSIQLAIGWRF